MHKNTLGPRAYLTALAVAVPALLGMATQAFADDTPSTLYHVQENTFGCADANTTRLLTDPTEPRKSNPAWMRTTIANGRCVTITPRSPWKLTSQDRDVALMEYAGTVGAPGSYYIAASVLVDPVGNHPGAAATAPNAPAPAPAPANSAAAAPNAAETALAPAPQDVPNPAGQAAFHGSWSTWDVLLLLLAISIAGVVGYAVGRNTRPSVP